MVTEYFPSTANSFTDTYLQAQNTNISLHSSNTFTNKYSSINVDNDTDIYIQSTDDTANTQSSISVNQNEQKNIYIESKNDNNNTKSQLSVDCNTNNANTRCGNYVVNSDEFRNSFMFSRNDAPGANTRSSISADDKYRLSGMWAFQHDGTTNEQLLTVTKVVAHNTSGSVLMASEDYTADIVSSVKTSFVDKNVVIAAEDTSASTKSSVDISADTDNKITLEAANTSDGSKQDLILDNGNPTTKKVILRSFNSIDQTQATLVLQESGGGVVRITTDDKTDGSKTVIDVNNAARKVNFITNDGAGSKSYFQVQNTDASKSILMVSENDDGQTKLAVDNKNKNIALIATGKTSNTHSRLVVHDKNQFVLGEVKDIANDNKTTFNLSLSSFAVVAPSMTVNGKTVVTQDDLTSIMTQLNSNAARITALESANNA